MGFSFTLFVHVNLMIVTDETWITYNADLRRIGEDEEMAIGAYNGSLFLLGGLYNNRQITQFKLDSNEMIDIGITSLSEELYGSGQYWTQKEHTLYLIVPTKYSPYVSQLAAYNMDTNQYTLHLLEITMNKDVSTQGCLTSSDQYLFIIGGFDRQQGVHSTLQMLNLDTYQWVSNTPNMRQIRHGTACIVSNNYLWTFGGDSGSISLSTNERINIINIEQNIWQYIESLSVPSHGPRAVLWKDSIYVVGGADVNAQVIWDILHIFDSVTGLITDAVTMPFSSVYSSPIVVDGVLYVFGGASNEGISVNSWMCYTIPSTTTPATTPITTATTTTTTETPITTAATTITTSTPISTATTTATTPITTPTTTTTTATPITTATSNTPLYTSLNDSSIDLITSKSPTPIATSATLASPQSVHYTTENQTFYPSHLSVFSATETKNLSIDQTTTSHSVDPSKLNKNSHTLFNDIYIVLIALISCFLCLFMLVLCVIHKKRKQYDNDAKVDNINLSQNIKHHIQLVEAVKEFVAMRTVNTKQWVGENRKGERSIRGSIANAKQYDTMRGKTTTHLQTATDESLEANEYRNSNIGADEFIVRGDDETNHL